MSVALANTDVNMLGEEQDAHVFCLTTLCLYGVTGRCWSPCQLNMGKDIVRYPDGLH